MKRKHAADPSEQNGHAAKITKSGHVHDKFHAGLFEQPVLKQYKAAYASSEPYKHAVIPELMADDLLRSVRAEIIENIHFTPKETDIYKIHQSGDLANLSGLPSSALERLPSLLKLRDALYSAEFRAWISNVSGAGALSGTKTDMAVNVYAPGCHLLCHDDVIGSRRVSYILYLTDPDKPWQEGWGGALRLYPTKSCTDGDGKVVKVPDPAWVSSIPPAWNQLSFFAVQPGESFHDVEEVYKRGQQDVEDDGSRIRMAISGWFHIPQEGEKGFEPGLEERLAERSSLQQLQGKNDAFDLPQSQWWDYSNAKVAHAAKDGEEVELTEQDLEFLLQYMTPHYLTPDTVDELSELFADESSLQLANFLSKKFSARLRAFLTARDGSDSNDDSESWKVARPPHKHRFLFRQPKLDMSRRGPSATVYDLLVEEFLPSLPFRKWLSLATGLGLGESDILARRFRKSLDYTLATAYEDEDAQLEWCLNTTPTKGWSADEEQEENGADGSSGGDKSDQQSSEEDNVGGYEIYMAGDDADDEDEDGSDHGVEVPSGPSATGAGNRRNARQRKADPAIYKSSADDEDDGILFSNPAAWNTMSIVLRDKGTLKFVKYVSKAARGDRWDFTGSVQVLDSDDSEDDGNDANGTTAHADAKADENHEEEWNGFDD